MHNLIKRYGQWAFVAGSATGIGEAFSLALASKGMNLIMLDHDKAALETVSDKIRDDYKVEIENVPADLGEERSSDLVLRKLKEKECRFLVYVAAYSKVKPFISNTLEELDTYVDVNVRTPLHVFHRFAGALQQNGQGAMIIMSSLGSMWGTKLLIPYGATKAFDLVLAESLHYELKDKDIDVMACVAGATTTPTYLASNPQYGVIKPPLQEPRMVAESALRNVGKKAVHICGWQNRLSYLIMTRFFSRGGAAKVFNRTIGRMYRHI